MCVSRGRRLVSWRETAEVRTSVFGVEELESTKIQSTKNVKTYQALVSGVI